MRSKADGAHGRGPGIRLKKRVRKNQKPHPDKHKAGGFFYPAQTFFNAVEKNTIIPYV
jgi:hypothetical protein